MTLLALTLSLVVATAAGDGVEARKGNVELTVAPGALWLGGTPHLHSFTESAQLGVGASKWLGALSADLATGRGNFGVAWFGVTYAFVTPWEVTVIRKHGDPSLPRLLDRATAHLFIVKGPAPKFRFQNGGVSLFGQATLGARTGFVLQAQETFSPIELMLCAAAGADYALHPRWSLGLRVEILHSLATGWSTGLAAIQVRGWL